MVENVMDGVSAIVAEARKTEAERMAKGEVPEAMRTTSVSSPGWSTRSLSSWNDSQSS
jgi:hypothetical protein